MRKIELNIILKLLNDIKFDLMGLYSFIKKLIIFLKVELFIVEINEKNINLNFDKIENIDLFLKQIKTFLSFFSYALFFKIFIAKVFPVPGIPNNSTNFIYLLLKNMATL